MIADAEIRAARILLVDDQSPTAALLAQLLEEERYTAVSVTRDPRAVCALHHTNVYDLILIDLQMQGIDGFELIEGLKSTETAPTLPVLVVTAQPEDKMRALESGVRDFISKPIDVIEVKTRIRNMLEVQILYKRLREHNAMLQKIVDERTAELRESEARYRSLTELASDWYWEQDETGRFTRISGPVLEMLGLEAGALSDADRRPADPGFNEAERAALREKIAMREPFLDFVFSRTDAGGLRHQFQVSGQPVFDQSCRFVGYRGVGIQLQTQSASP